MHTISFWYVVDPVPAADQYSDHFHGNEECRTSQVVHLHDSECSHVAGVTHKSYAHDFAQSHVTLVLSVLV
jgi:hypothetical protein